MPIREDQSASELRALARRETKARVAARLAGMDRQALRGAVVRYNPEGVQGFMIVRCPASGADFALVMPTASTAVMSLFLALQLRWIGLPPVEQALGGCHILHLVEGACFHRPAALPAQGLDGKPGPPRQGLCTGGCALRHQADHRRGHGAPGNRRRGPFRLVAADSVHGVGELEMALRRAGKGDVLGVTGSHRFNSRSPTLSVSGTAEEIARDLPAETWIRLSAGDGTEGPRLYD